VVSSILGTSRLVGSCRDCTAGGEALAIHIFPKFPILHLKHEAARDLIPISFFIAFQGSVLQNREHVACQYAHSVIYWSLAHNCRENQKDCIILLATQAQCAELLKRPTFMDWVCVFGLSNPARKAHAPYCHVWPVWLCYYIFPHYTTKGTIFENKKLLNIKCVIWFSLQILSEIFLILRKIQRDAINVHSSSCTVPAVLVRFK
jgi:hypothetical protein